MDSRSKNAKRNIISGFIRKGQSIILQFLIRTIILYILGAKYLGLTSLFTSVLTVLSLMDLGFSNAIIFCMYKPVAENDKSSICAYLSYFKKIYFITGIVIMTVGIISMPILKFLIHSDLPGDINIYIIYLVYLFNTVCSYFLYAYKGALLDAFQRIDISNNIQSAVLLCQHLFQILILIVFENYYYYVVLTPVFSVIYNLLIAYITKRKYPEYICSGVLSNFQKERLYSRVKGLIISRISETSRNSFDSIIISSIMGLTNVAIYNNYYYIHSSIYSFMVAINQGIQSSIGNSLVCESKKKNLKDLFKFMSEWLICFCVVSLLSLYQPFMIFWVGKELCISEINMFLFCLYFYVLNMCNIRNLYFDGCGLWDKGKYTYCLETVGNLFLNIFLGMFIGMSGILIATIMTLFIFSFILRTNILFKEYFHVSPRYFYIKHTLYALIIMIIAFSVCFLNSFVNIDGIVGLIMKEFICIFVSNFMYIILNFWNTDMKESVMFLKNLLLVK